MGQCACMKLASSAFKNEEPIPERYTAYGAELSPPLIWNDVPEQAQTLVLVCDDPDAPNRPFIHWVVYNIPADSTGLPEDLPFTKTPLDGMRQALNDYHTAGWGAPFPPPGPTHKYYFKLYALDCDIPPGYGNDYHDVLRVMEGHVIEEAVLIGTYARPEPPRASPRMSGLCCARAEHGNRFVTPRKNSKSMLL